MELFVTGFLLSLSLALDLGIVNVAILKTGFEKGFWPSVILGFGSSVADLVYVSLSVSRIAYIVDNILVRWFLWIVGSLVLLLFCVRMVLQSIKLPTQNESKVIKTKNDHLLYYWMKGFALSLSSPSSIIWFTTIGGSVIATQHLNSKIDLLGFFGGFFAAGFVWSILLAYISNRGGQGAGPKIRKTISVVSAAIFLILAIYVFMNGYRELILK